MRADLSSTLPKQVVVPSTRRKALRSFCSHLLDGKIHVVLGRFRLMRQLDAAFKAVSQRHMPALRQACLAPRKSSVLKCRPVHNMFDDLREDGVALGLELPKRIVKQIKEHALAAPCTRWGVRAENGRRFTIREVKDGWLDDGLAVAIADVDLSGISETIAEISHDPVILEVIRKGFGYDATRVERRLFWSNAIKITPSVDNDLSNVLMPSNFHYDLSGMNSLYAYFYITSADTVSGAHVVVKQSQNRKPVSMLLSSRFQHDDAIQNFYGTDKLLTISGQPGSGFIENASCFHKGLVPTKNKRLMLQLRYY